MKLKGKKGRSLPRETEAEETKKGKRRIEEAFSLWAFAYCLGKTLIETLRFDLQRHKNGVTLFFPFH